ncbi:hypothetical protein C8R41DRAFT_406413 [Lentinula lateritia]|uniref:DUF6699 domain-containing protein n=1 Tax=Lentinula lateritia TaxID=40482 RepID=A0ABQ8VCY6_9AGAR|nr:hypothetical protein C8R41DRAFT_406413 [Lentinula lateritia]
MQPQNSRGTSNDLYDHFRRNHQRSNSDPTPVRVIGASPPSPQNSAPEPPGVGHDESNSPRPSSAPSGPSGDSSLPNGTNPPSGPPGVPSPSNGASPSSNDSSRNRPSNVSYPVPPSPVVPWPFRPFPYHGNAPPPLPPPAPSFVVPTVPSPVHYHYVPSVPPNALPTPQLPLWPTPAVPSILSRPAMPAPGSAVMWESGTFPMSPLGGSVPLRVHPHILYNPMSPSLPVLQWDIVLRAEQARVLTGQALIKRPSLNDEAVVPAPTQSFGLSAGARNGQTDAKINKIWIESDTPLLAWWMQRWGPIIIEKSNITVRDVLDAVHTYLSIPLTNGDYKKAVEVQTPTDGVNHGNGMRLRSARRLRASNGCELRSVALRGRALEDGWSAQLMGADPGESSIYRRSDLLGTYRRFLGLRPIVFSDGSWKLLLGLGPGPVPKFS